MNALKLGICFHNHTRSFTVLLAASIAAIFVLSVGMATVSAGNSEKPRAAGEKDYYVDNTNVGCSDVGVGTSPSTPFCTITQAGNVAIAGDRIHVLAGTYAETVKPNFDGAAGNPISFLGSAGVVVTGTAGDATTGGGFRLAGKNYIIIDGFKIQGTADYGIVAIGCTHITITNNRITTAGDTTNNRTGIYLKNVTDSLIEGNTTDHNSLDGIRLNTCTNVTVNKNISYGNSAVTTRVSEGINLLASTGNFVTHNTVYANDDSGINLYTGSIGNQVIGNIVYGNGDHGIDNNDSPNNVIVGNTVQGNVTSGINLEGTSGSAGATIENNIVVDNGFLQGAPGGTPGNIRTDINSIAGTTLNYNLYYLSGGLYQVVWGSGGGSNYPTLANFTAANPTQETNGLEGNPLLTSPAVIATRPASPPFTMAINTGNFHINFGSPAIDSANADATGEPTSDIAGSPRVDFLVVTDTGSGIRTYDDRGAYEFQPPTCYLLTINPGVHGTTPTASPLHSAQCAVNGQYILGETINLSGAVADSGYQISGWTGTNNDASLLSTNTVTMPAAARTAGVIYGTTNVPPVITQGTSVGVTMSEDSAPTPFNLTLNATDANGDTLTWSISTPAAHGTAGATGTGASKAIIYTPVIDFSGTDSFVVQVSDGRGGTDTITVNVTIQTVNDAPVITEGVSVLVNISEDNSPTLFSLTLHATDVDTAGSSLTWSISAQAIHGTATVSGTGLSKVIGFTPTANYNGTDSFVVQVSDGSLTDTITVNVSLSAVNDAPVCAALPLGTAEDTMGEISPSCTDIDGDVLGYSIVGVASNGTALVFAGKLRYVPNSNYNGGDSFTYKAYDTLVDSNTATVTVTVTPVNDAPVITNTKPAMVIMSEDGSPTPFSLTLNATDIDTAGSSLTWSISTTALHGTANVTGTGASKAINYIPASNYNGSDSFGVQVSDGFLVDTITVNVTIQPVNDAPVCSVVVLTTTEDTVGDTAPFCSDPDTGAVLTYEIVAQGTHGTASVVVGMLHFIPTLNYAGLDTFTYKAYDGTVYSAPASVTVTMTPVNDAPVCAALPLTTAEDSQAEISPSCVDPDVGDTLGYSIVATAPNGTASVVSGKLRYFPNANFNGGDTFSYKANDTHVDSNTAGVTVTVTAVNDAPVITEGASTGVTMSEDGSPLAFSLTLHGTDVEGNTLTWSISSGASHGIATATGSGSAKAISYTPNANFNGSDSFVVQVSDGLGGTDTINVNVTIQPVNDAPTCSSIPLMTDEDVTGETAPFCTDVDGTPLTYSIVSGTSHGTALVVSGNLRYVPDANYYGGDSFAYKASDGSLESTPATVTVTVNPVNDAPVCSPVSLTTLEDTPGEAAVSCNDIEGDALTYSIAGAASHGIATAGIGKLYYSPAANYFGGDSFTYKARDASADSNISTVTVTVSPVNDAPVCSAVNFSTNEDTMGETSPSCSDVEGNPLTYSIVGNATHGTTLVVSGKLRFTPATNYYGPDSFTYKANDSFVDGNTATASVNVLPVNDAPVISETDPVLVNMSKNGIPVPFALTLNASDIEGDTLTWSITLPASHGTASVSGTGLSKGVGYIPNTDYLGNDSFAVQISDGNGGLDSITVNVSIIEMTYIISGSTGIGNVELSFFDYTSKSVISDDAGAYSLSVSYDWTGEITPTNEGYSFSPVSRSYTGVRADQFNQDYGAWAPADHSTIPWNLPRFSWPAIIGATGYQLQVSKSSTFSTTIINSTVTGTGFTPAAMLPANSHLYWRVKANGVNPSAWSEVWEFTSANPPGVPVLVSPANNGLVTDYTPKLDWKDVVAPLGTVFDKYQVQVATDSGFAPAAIVLDEEVTSGVGVSEYTPGADLTADRKYYWRVRSYNGDGQYSGWSSVWVFRAGMRPPELSAPANDASNALKETRPKFEWTEADAVGAVSYTLQVSAYANMSSPVVNVTVASPGLSYVPVKDLPQGKVLYWRVMANGANPSGWSAVWSLKSANPPSVPVLVSPANNALTEDYTPKLDWKDSTVPLGTVFGKYQVQVGKGGVSDSTPKVDVLVSDYTPLSDLESNANYFWRVRVCNMAGECSTWSGARVLRTAMTPPELSAPADVLDPPLLTTRPEFRWGAVNGALNYTLQVSASAGMSSPVLTAIVSGVAYTPSSDLPKGKVLYWRVKANGVNPSAWSEVWEFTSANPPGVPVLISPTNNTLTSLHKPWFDWKDSSLPSGTTFYRYEFQMASDAEFNSLEIDNYVSGITSSDYVPATKITSNLKHYWRVKGCNTSDQCSLWSSVWYFRSALDEPELLYPGNQTVITTRRPAFDWNDVPKCDSYTIQISSSPTITVTLTDSTYTPLVDLPVGQTLYWKVKANGANQSDWSDVWSFTISQ
jgi:parallel beta-helix repeat protein